MCITEIMKLFVIMSKHVLSSLFFSPEFSNDRCAPSGAPAEIELAAFSRNCYEFNVAKGMSFDDARRQCQAQGGDLIHGFQVRATDSNMLCLYFQLKYAEVYATVNTVINLERYHGWDIVPLSIRQVRVIAYLMFSISS